MLERQGTEEPRRVVFGWKEVGQPCVVIRSRGWPWVGLWGVCSAADMVLGDKGDAELRPMCRMSTHVDTPSEERGRVWAGRDAVSPVVGGQWRRKMCH